MDPRLKTLSLLLATFRAPNSDSETTLATYHAVCSDLPAAALDEAVRRILMTRESPFLPTPAEVRKVVGQVLGDVRQLESGITERARQAGQTYLTREQAQVMLDELASEPAPTSREGRMGQTLQRWMLQGVIKRDMGLDVRRSA